MAEILLFHHTRAPVRRQSSVSDYDAGAAALLEEGTLRFLKSVDR